MCARSVLTKGGPHRRRLDGQILSKMMLTSRFGGLYLKQGCCRIVCINSGDAFHNRSMVPLAGDLASLASLASQTLTLHLSIRTEVGKSPGALVLFTIPVI